MPDPTTASKPRFAPRFTLGLVYVFVFFFVYCIVFALPELAKVANSGTPGPEMQELAKQAAYGSTRARLPYALVGAIATVAAAAYARVLPGMRGPA